MDTNKPMKPTRPDTPGKPGKPGKSPRPRLPDWTTPGWLLGAFAAVFLFSLALTHSFTADKIAAQEKAKLQRQLRELLPPGIYDNAPGEDFVAIARAAPHGKRQAKRRGGRVIYRARLNGEPAAALIKTTAPDGYNGAIELLVGVAADGRLLGVRVLKHQETPGLGDAMELRRTDWLLNFDGKSLANPPPALWAVKKDGGAFDAFTGATITPRAVVAEVKATLAFFHARRHDIFHDTPQAAPQNTPADAPQNTPQNTRQ